jgi:hypothetical protein
MGDGEESLRPDGRPNDDMLASAMGLDEEGRRDDEGPIDAPDDRGAAAIMINGRKLDGDGRMAAPPRKRRLDARAMFVEPLGVHGLMKDNDGATALAPRKPLELVPMIAIKPNPKGLAPNAPGLDVDKLGIDGKDADEPDAIFANLGRIAFFGGVEEGEEGPLDDGAIHARPIVPKRDGGDAAGPLDADGDGSRASIDAVLNELTHERIRISKLPNHLSHRPSLRPLDNALLALGTIRHNPDEATTDEGKPTPPPPASRPSKDP